MAAKKWFDRSFDFNLSAGSYAGIYLRLQAAPDELGKAVEGLAEPMLEHKPDGGWSVKEHVGHLSILETLWRRRFQDIDEGRPELTTTDLTNQATTEAGFNRYPIGVLLDRFRNERSTTLALLDTLHMLNESRTSLHPRMRKPMRMIDNAYFVAEHDEHHIRRIREIASL